MGITKVIRDQLWSMAPQYGRLETEVRLQLAKRRSWELMFIDALRTDLSRSSIDVGANIGVFSRLLSRRFAAVMSFEPNPSVARRLGASSGRNVTVRREALSDRDGMASLVVPRVGRSFKAGLGTLQTSSLGSEKTVTYPVVTRRLDTCVGTGQTVGMVKIDVEGHELSVLRGSVGLLERDGPALLVEAEERHRPGTVSDVRCLLTSFGYSGYFVWRAQILSVDDFDPQRHQLMDGSEYVGEFANNFLYLTERELDSHLQTLASIL